MRPEVGTRCALRDRGNRVAGGKGEVMAELVTIDGQQYKKRSPWGAWLLCLTVVYVFIWYYKVNKEAKQYLNDDSSPGLRTLGLIVPLLNLFIHYRLGESTERVEEKA